MTLLQETVALANTKWPDQMRNFYKCSLGRVKHDIRGALGLHAAAGEVLLTRHSKVTEWAMWATRTETWIFVSKQDVVLLDSDGSEMEAA